MFNFLHPYIPRMRKPVVETVVQHAVKTPALPSVLTALPEPAKLDSTEDSPADKARPPG